MAAAAEEGAALRLSALATESRLNLPGAVRAKHGLGPKGRVIASTTTTEETTAAKRKRLVEVALAAIAELPDVRTSRVEAIQAALATGAYKPSAEAIAARLASTLGLGGGLLWRR